MKLQETQIVFICYDCVSQIIYIIHLDFQERETQV